MRLAPLYAFLLALLPLVTLAQSVGIGNAFPPASAALEIKSTTQGVLFPRLTSAQRAAIVAPVAGLMIFQTDFAPGMYYYNGTAWLNLTTGLQASTTSVVSTLTGSGTPGFADGPAASAQFNFPYGVACDGSGNVFVADRNNSRIRRIVAATGAVSTLAGSGTAGFADGPGPTAQFFSPYGVACDGSGNVFVADYGNQRIRKIVAATGAVSTLAGSGTAGFADGAAASAQFRNPTGVACDGSGNVFVADQANHRIRKIVAATGTVSTLAGGAAGSADGTGPAAGFNFPYGVACDGSGNVFVADQGNHRIRRIVAATGAVSTLAGSAQGFADGTGPAAQFSNPTGVACDGSGNVFVADYGNQRIRQIVAATGVVSTLAGSGTAGFADGPAVSAQFNSPNGVACDGGGTVFVADLNNHRIRAIR